jgi:hypothetical protein
LNGLLIAFRFLLSSFKEAIHSDTNSGPSEKEYEPPGEPRDLAAKKSGETEEEKARNQAGKQATSAIRLIFHFAERQSCGSDRPLRGSRTHQLMVRLQFSEFCSEISWSFLMIDCPESGLVSDDLAGVPKFQFNCPMIALGHVDCPVERSPNLPFLILISDIFLVGCLSSHSVERSASAAARSAVRCMLLLDRITPPG